MSALKNAIPNPIRVLCVDDHTFLADGLQARLDAESDMLFVGHLPSAENLEKTVAELTPHIVLLDIDMPGRDPFEALRDLGRVQKEVRVIIFSAYVRDRYIDLAYKAGAWGYLAKTDAPEAIITGIREVIAGRIASSPEVRERTAAAAARSADGQPAIRSKLDSITRRELEVLRMIARGMSRTDIASELHRSPMTIDNHRKSIMRKLDIHDRGELVRFAIAEGLVEA